jgi:very-short-patch-repair endonuclease
MDGLTGFASPGIHVLLPGNRQVRKECMRVPVVVHRSRLLGTADIHPVRLPPRTRLARSLVDAAAWMATADRARAVLAAGVQQRLVRADDLMTVAGRCVRLRRRSLITATLADIAGGAQALSELDFARLLRRFRIPEPDRQAERRDSCGRRRWLDALWKKARLIVEVDGLWHMDAMAWWDDMRRDNEFTVSGFHVLRFPAFAVRCDPEAVASQIRGALRLGGRGGASPRNRVLAGPLLEAGKLGRP